MSFISFIRDTFDLPAPVPARGVPARKIDEHWVGKYQEEDISVLLRLIWRDGTISGSRRDFEFVAMCLSGMTLTLPAALVAAFFSSPLFLLWLPIGALKGVSYALGWRYAVPEVGLQPTVMGEYLTGFMLCGGAGLLWYWV